ncbi:glycosyltransferase [Anabaena catenula]|uniref:Glycosyltransferase n=1 Tax=Anabaena catenula FACHB-362 TaxID=2692877 RepID=A0ABR8J496_9NOST|nr:glycosyltransferase [Anabaena catenula]MBD2693188.1 glycosyltransferase [Anabaena catenula FACHB-362]
MKSVISVIIPVYNGEKTIRETLESVLNQSFSLIEVIIINDGSTDATLEIIQSISDSRLQVFSYPNSGIAVSRNRGIAKASGEYIAFIDADDLWKPDKLKFQVNTLEQNSEAAVAYSWCDHIDESSRFLRSGSRFTANGDVYSKLLVANFLENGSNPLIRADALASIGGFEASLSPAEDWDLWLRLARQYHFVVIPYPQVLYRISSTSLSSNILKMEVVSLQIIKCAFSQAPESLQHLSKYSIGNLYKYLLYKILEKPSEKNTPIICLRFLWNIVKNDSSILFSKLFVKILLKILMITLLNNHQKQVFMQKFRRFSDTSTLLGYLKFDNT